MKRFVFLLSLLVVLAACSSSGPSSSVSATPGAGAVAIEILPNPIVARAVAGSNQYDFPFEVVVRETGGHPVSVTRVSADLFALGGLKVGSESWDADKIRSMGYGVDVPANGELRYRFNPRREVPDERLFGGVRAELRVDARDASGATTSASTVVTVTR
jgi:hypothetical protein